MRAHRDAPQMACPLLHEHKSPSPTLVVLPAEEEADDRLVGRESVSRILPAHQPDRCSLTPPQADDFWNVAQGFDRGRLQQGEVCSTCASLRPRCITARCSGGTGCFIKVLIRPTGLRMTNQLSLAQPRDTESAMHGNIRTGGKLAACTTHGALVEARCVWAKGAKCRR